VRALVCGGKGDSVCGCVWAWGAGWLVAGIEEFVLACALQGIGGG
jgi:hypothetical protein